MFIYTYVLQQKGLPKLSEAKSSWPVLMVS
jgi:hypothetical protein